MNNYFTLLFITFFAFISMSFYSVFSVSNTNGVLNVGLNPTCFSQVAQSCLTTRLISQKNFDLQRRMKEMNELSFLMKRKGNNILLEFTKKEMFPFLMNQTTRTKYFTVHADLEINDADLLSDLEQNGSFIKLKKGVYPIENGLFKYSVTIPISNQR